MPALRILGVVFGLALFAASVVRYHKRDISRLNLIITGAISIGFVVLAVAPAAFNPLFTLLNFRRGGGQRLIGLLLIATVVLFALVIRNMSYTDMNLRSIRLLVEALAVQSFERSQTSGLPPGRKIVVVMPAYNESQNISPVVHAMPEELDGYPVVAIVVDDGSEDETSEVARAAGAVVARLPLRRGQGLALRVGYEIAARLDAVIVVTMDADGQHLP